MLRKLFVIIFTVVTSFSFAQSINSVLAEGSWYKFSIDTTGVFKIDKAFLQSLGISVNSIDPRNLHIYGNGGQMLPEKIAETRYPDLQENSIFIEGEDDGSFDANDYILFYATGPHSWSVNTQNNTATHHQNIYSDKGYYFITINEKRGRRIEQLPEINQDASITVTSFDDYTFYEKEERNLFAAGRKWVGEDFTVENVQSFKIPFPNNTGTDNVRITVRAVAASSTISTMDIKVGGNRVTNLNFGSISTTLASERTASALLQLSGNSVDVQLEYNNNGNPSAKAYLDYIEVVGKKKLLVNDYQFGFRSFEVANMSGIAEFQLANTSPNDVVWDVTNPLEPKMVVNQSASGYTFKVNGGVLSEYVVIKENDYYQPNKTEVTKVTNQNLHGLQNVNYLIITNKELESSAQRLADYHIQNSSLTVRVIDVNQIYNEFSSGSNDITGIRDFIRYIYNTNTTDDGKLKYVCFFGDASYDYKDRISDNNNVIPVFEAVNSYNMALSYVTDDYFVMIEDHEGSMATQHTVDVASGRIPVDNTTQADEIVEKIISYNTDSAFGDWRNSITLLADDIDANFDISIQSGMEKTADLISLNKPVFNLNKIYADSYVQQNTSGGESYPEVRNDILNSLEKGTLIFDYFGHGGEDGFASERILDRELVNNLTNDKTLPLFITVTCEFSRFDNPRRITAGEELFWNKNGGAASMITTTREVFITTGQSFNEKLLVELLEFNNEDLTMAESLAKTKNNFGSFQKFFIYYFGDPAQKLAVPKPNVKITHINDKDIFQTLDTLKALSTVRIKGIVTDNKDQKLTNFNGVLSTLVFDKPIQKTTLDNDGFGVKLDFDSQESKLFRGQSSVNNGDFEFEFVIPKDIRIAFGKGKVSFYANGNGLEKGGFNNDIVVGGINTNAPEDTIGPEMSLFMNDESFIDGGNTNSSPNVIVKLSDISGINTSVTAVDHDIVAIIDGDASNPIILNDYYQTELDDFTNGKVVYRLRDLEVGQHTLTVKAWDTYNNSSEATLNFVVVSDAGMTLDNVLNYPNPFVNYTEFWFNHNKPDEQLEVQVQVFTVSGKLIKTINQHIQTEGNLSRSIVWDGRDDFGNKIGKGVYVYKLKVKSTTNNIFAEKFEKLVIL